MEKNKELKLTSFLIKKKEEKKTLNFFLKTKSEMWKMKQTKFRSNIFQL